MAAVWLRCVHRPRHRAWILVDAVLAQAFFRSVSCERSRASLPRANDWIFWAERRFHLRSRRVLRPRCAAWMRATAKVRCKNARQYPHWYM